jgi:hypothetical protein
LKLPGSNDFSNVLRVKRTSTFNDTLDAPLPQYATGTVTMHLWYSEIYKEFLMINVQASSPTLGTVSAVAWTLPNLAGIDDASGSFAFSSTPNPAQDHIAVRWSGDEEATLALQDLTGRTVALVTGRGEATLQVGDLPRGMYLLRATSAAGAATTRKVSLR